MSKATTGSKLQFWMYRLSTIVKSLKTLYTLPQDKIDAFLGSYNIYDHDWVNEEQLIKDMGADYYKEVKKKLIDYYSVLNHLCAIGHVEKMYIPPAMDLSAGIIENQSLFERRMCRDLRIGPGSYVLDVGCGRGRVASHVASFTGAHVTGINIDQDQLASARRFATGKGLAHLCHFQTGDLNEIPFAFADNSLDAIYEIQVVFSLSKNLEKVFADLHRMLKPGSRFACLEWVRLPKYDPTNAHHANLMKRIKPLIGAIGTPSIDECTTLLKKVGFEIVISENASIDGLQAPLIDNADKFFTLATKLVEFGVRWKLLPRHFKALFDRLTKDGQAFVEADRMRLVTTSHYIVAQKN